MRLALLLAFALLLPACSRKSEPDKGVVLYSSIDAGVIKPILDAYTKRTGVRVDLVADTETTKTTGLINRLVTEKNNPRADVWWSGEVVGTAQLSRAGVLAPYNSLAADAAARACSHPGWPVRGTRGDWFGLALRPRVIVYATKAYPQPDSAPRSLEALAGSKKPVAIANPAFGTTRGHLAALYITLGRDDFTKLMSSVEWRVVDGNAAVVRAVANGECDLGITDYDDYQSGLANNWPLGSAFLSLTADPAGPVVATPGTIALIRGAPHPDLAKAFIDEMLSIATEQTLAAGEWSSMPVLKGVATPGDRFKGLTPAEVDWEKAADFLDEAAAAWAESQKPER
ncbi:MAG TPA: extracellular solute-binding protein [Phycisphaerales bacterium]|nr:extracellular solute-binding protein [Phycisphaerales bacterium]